jgi:hypothetical protein
VPQNSTGGSFSFYRTGSQRVRRDQPQQSYQPYQQYYEPTTTTTTEAPPRIHYRQYGYVCEITVLVTYCEIGTECDATGKTLDNQKRYVN